MICLVRDLKHTGFQTLNLQADEVGFKLSAAGTLIVINNERGNPFLSG